MSESETFQRQILRLHQVQTWGRWLFNLSLWLTLGTLSIWSLQQDIALWLEYFTWAAVRVSLQHNRLAFFGLGFCVANTLATLVWQSWHILCGFSGAERASLSQQIQKISQQGEKHPLWRWVIAEKI
ncbi:MAG: hypothetical protein SFT94_03125 [Pseudanabaenaceae cyanobacterium bins.68]|nr:hypothetical protein [Pseudanabaenaceae cyanobacterium bins.68]